MARHALKTDPEVFQASWAEEKNFEIRFDDKNYQVGDELLLLETVYSGNEMKEGRPLEYTGKFLEQEIMYKLKDRYGLIDGWCILGTCLNYGEEYMPESSEFKQLIKPG